MRTFSELTATPPPGGLQANGKTVELGLGEEGVRVVRGTKGFGCGESLAILKWPALPAGRAPPPLPWHKQKSVGSKQKACSSSKTIPVRTRMLGPSGTPMGYSELASGSTWRTHSSFSSARDGVYARLPKRKTELLKLWEKSKGPAKHDSRSSVDFSLESLLQRQTSGIFLHGLKFHCCFLWRSQPNGFSLAPGVWKISHPLWEPHVSPWWERHVQFTDIWIYTKF